MVRGSISDCGCPGVTSASVPQITIYCGASFGAGNYGMCGRGFHPRFCFSWPNAKTAVMGGEQAAETMAIVAEAGASGNPTPEGLHRDGVDYIVSMLVSRSNVEGGETTITNNDREVLWQRTLQRPLDIMVGLDAQTLHSVTPVTPLDPQRPAWRDVLVVAFTKVQP